MTPLAQLHLIVLGLWGGVILVEIVFEWLGYYGRLDPKAVALLHRYTDRFLEVPILAGVLTTGFLLWGRTGWSFELLPKVGAGVGAVLANAVCFAFVERRASSQDMPRSQTHAVFLTALPGFPLAALALYLGGLRTGWW